MESSDRSVAPGTDQFESSLLQWRARALQTVLWAIVGVGMVPFVVIFLLAPDALPPHLDFVALASLGVFLGIALARRLPHHVRVWCFLAAQLALAGVMLAYKGLEGSGRVLLVVLPVYATVLLGARAGYAAAAASLTVYGAAAYSAFSGLFVPASQGSSHSVEVQVWVLQGAMLLLAVGAVMVLVDRFVALFRRVLDAEREAARRIMETERERSRLEQVLLETGERERREIGHQLHDGPCQQLTAALLRCRVTENNLTARGSREEVAQLRTISELLESSVGEIHDLARGLAPAMYFPDSLAAALHELAERVRASGSVECHVVHDGLALPSDPESAGQLFHIAQEAVSNAVRHANPRRIRIELMRGDGRLELVVRDDGSGIAPGRNEEGMGLRIMRHRAERMGGALSIAAEAGGGTAVTCALPLRHSGELCETSA